MKVVWERESVTVRNVYEAILKKRKVAYTTIMTMMKILEQKKYLKKSQSKRAYVYRAAQPKRQVIGAMVKEFVNRCSTHRPSHCWCIWSKSTTFRPRTGRRSRNCRGSHDGRNALGQRSGIACRSGLVVVAVFVPLVLRLQAPRARLLFWHLLLAACLMLPLVRPAQRTAANASVEVTSTSATIAPAPE